MLAVANAFASKPIVFVAVNSGTDPQALKSYVRKHEIPFPVLGDYDRSFERELGVNEISLNNILSIQLLKADGQVVAGDWRDMEKSATAALEGADWNVSPKGMPKALQPAWRSIETGEFAKAAEAVTASLTSKEPKVEAAAKRLNDYAQQVIASRVDTAKTVMAFAHTHPMLHTPGNLRRTFINFTRT